MQCFLFQIQLLHSLSFFHLESLVTTILLFHFWFYTLHVFELHRMTKSPESVVNKPEVTYGLLFALCNKMAAMWSILVAAMLFFVRSGCFWPINESITLFKWQWYLTKGTSKKDTMICCRDRDCWPGGYSKKVLYGEAPPRGPTPYPFVDHFFRKGTPFV